MSAPPTSSNYRQENDHHHQNHDQQTMLLQDLEGYLGRLIHLVEGGAGTSTAATTGATGRSRMAAPASTKTSWLENEPPDTLYPPSSSSSSQQQSRAVLATNGASHGGSSSLNSGAEGFLRELEQLIKVFLSTQQQKQQLQPLSEQHPTPTSSAAAATARAAPPTSSATPQLSKETETRVEVLRQAVAAAEASAASRNLTAAAGPSYQPILQQIDTEWDATLQENSVLKNQLVQANQQSTNLQQAKESAEQLLREKDLLLQQIRHAIAELKQELERHKLQQQQQENTSSATREAPTTMMQQQPDATNRAAAAAAPDPTALQQQQQRRMQEKQALVAKLRQSIMDLEGQLSRIQGEKRGLEDELNRTRQVLRTHQSLKQTLEQSFSNTETEIQALRRMLAQVEVDSSKGSGLLPSSSAPYQPPSTTTAPVPAFQPPTSTQKSYPVQVETVQEGTTTPVRKDPNINNYYANLQDHQSKWQPATTTNGMPHKWESTAVPPFQPTQVAVYKIDTNVPAAEAMVGGASQQQDPEWSSPTTMPKTQAMSNNGSSGSDPPSSMANWTNHPDGAGGRHLTLDQPPPPPQEQEQGQRQHPRGWNFDPPAEYLAVDGSHIDQQPQQQQRNLPQEQRQAWRQLEPLAAPSSGTGSHVYSRGGISRDGVGGSFESSYLSERSASYDNGGSTLSGGQVMVPLEQQPLQQQQHSSVGVDGNMMTNSNASVGWTNSDAGGGPEMTSSAFQQPPSAMSSSVWDEYASAHQQQHHHHQRQPEFIVEVPSYSMGVRPSGPMGGMAYIQQQMAEAVHEARNNPTAAAAAAPASQHAARLPLQPPAPASAMVMADASPERTVPHRGIHHHHQHRVVTPQRNGGYVQQDLSYGPRGPSMMMATTGPTTPRGNNSNHVAPNINGGGMSYRDTTMQQLSPRPTQGMANYYSGNQKDDTPTHSNRSYSNNMPHHRGGRVGPY